MTARLLAVLFLLSGFLLSLASDPGAAAGAPRAVTWVVTAGPSLGLQLHAVGPALQVRSSDNPLTRANGALTVSPNDPSRGSFRGRFLAAMPVVRMEELSFEAQDLSDALMSLYAAGPRAHRRTLQSTLEALDTALL